METGTERKKYKQQCLRCEYSAQYSLTESELKFLKSCGLPCGHQGMFEIKEVKD